MSVVDGESPAEKPVGNPTEGINPKSTGPIDWNIPWTDYAVEQAQIAQKTIESTLDNAIEVTRSRVDRILTTSSAHFNQTIDSLQDLKSDYSTYEDIVFGKIKGLFETLLSRADTKVKEFRQSIDLLKAESEKLEKKALQAEEDLVRGRTKLRLRTLLKRRKKKGMPCPRKLQRSATMGSQSKSLTGFGSLSMDIKPLFALYDLVFGLK
ncbi:hypothetical protein DH2020_045541 [Rehmannia glutinosa]|uniref:Uncharacterized protein n=1 Tax=Rehmannia glutinosa TaxID=99300 RepID=A0ABR0UFK0_REHGL